MVADEASGRALAPQLVQGQRLVSRAGALWRWDGFTMAAGAPTAAAVRLGQRNRQAVLAKELAEAEARVQEVQDRFAEAREIERAGSERDEASRQALAAAPPLLRRRQR